MLNEKVIKIIKNCGFEVDNILLYLLSLHYNLTPTYIPELTKKQTNITGIIQRDYTNGTVVWTVPLFDSEPQQQVVSEDQKWDWVHTDFRKLFMDIKTTAGGDKKGCTKKMKNFFAENPDVRKEEVIEAAKLYLLEFADGSNNPKFMQRADYFISKALKADGSVQSQSRLSQFLEIISIDKISTGPTTNRLTRGLL